MDVSEAPNSGLSQNICKTALTLTSFPGIYNFLSTKKKIFQVPDNLQLWKEIKLDRELADLSLNLSCAVTNGVPLRKIMVLLSLNSWKLKIMIKNSSTWWPRRKMCQYMWRFIVNMNPSWENGTVKGRSSLIRQCTAKSPFRTKRESAPVTWCVHIYRSAQDLMSW